MSKIEKRLRINRLVPDGMLAQFVNDLTITRSEETVVLVFSQVQPPRAFSGDELAGIESVDAIAVSKLVMSIGFAKAVVKLLEGNLGEKDE